MTVAGSSETKCSNPFCTDGQTEQGSCLRCGGTGRETIARPSKDVLRGVQAELIKIAAGLVQGTHIPIEFNEDNFYKSTPVAERRRIRKAIERLEEHGRVTGIKLRQLFDKLSPLIRSSDETSELPITGRQVERIREFYLGYLSGDLPSPVFDKARRRDTQSVADALNEISAYHAERGELKALPPQCSCDPNPSIGGSPPCPVHDGESEVSK